MIECQIRTTIILPYEGLITNITSHVGARLKEEQSDSTLIVIARKPLKKIYLKNNDGN